MHMAAGSSSATHILILFTQPPVWHAAWLITHRLVTSHPPSGPPSHPLKCPEMRMDVLPCALLAPAAFVSRGPAAVPPVNVPLLPHALPASL